MTEVTHLVPCAVTEAALGISLVIEDAVQAKDFNK